MEKFTDSKQRIEKIEKKYDATARKNFSKPANYCQFCGQEMIETDDQMKNRWQQRWSIHFECANQVDNQLDRSVGILSERTQRK